MEHLWLIGLSIYDLMSGAFISLNGWDICHLMGRAFITWHCGLMGGGLWFNGWGTYGLSGWDSNGKLLFRLEICWSCFSHLPGAGVTARFSLCEAGGAEDSKEREPEEEEGH